MPNSKSNNAFGHTPKLLKALKLPLVTAISSCLLMACSSTPTSTTKTTTSTVANSGYTGSTGNTGSTGYTGNSSYGTTTWGQSAIGNQPAQSSPVLDMETLALLDDLLEARDMSMVEGDRLTVERYGNLWDRIRKGYRMTQPSYNARIEAQKSWFSGRQDYLNRLTARASRYLHHTVTEAERRGIPTELALLPIIESSYDPSATSNAAAAGLWQFIPSTGRIYGLNQTYNYDGRRDVIESTRAAYDFLTSLYNQFGSWELALAAYNAGPGRIQKAINDNAAQGLPTDYWSLRLPTETMNYVPRFMAVAQIVGQPAQYGVSLPAIANHAHFRTVTVNQGVDLRDVSQITNVPVGELQLLNPALTNLRVDAAGPSRVVIPNIVPNHLDAKLKALAGNGINTQNMTAQTTQYIAPEAITTTDARSIIDLQNSNTLPTTAAALTSNNTILQEPPLSQEERNFIAAQIQSTNPTVQPINERDGAIKLDAVQTAQSVLESRQQQKTLTFDSNDTLRGTGSVPTSGSQTVAPNRSTATNGSVYIVQRGDTLSGIAAKYGVSTQQLAQWNQMNVNSTLLAGSRLKVVGTPTNSTTTTKPTTTKRTADSYTVKSGDTLSSIAAKHNLTVSQLASYNGIPTTTKVKSGQKLWLVAGKTAGSTATTTSSTIKTTNYKVKAGDTLTGVARSVGMTTDELAKLNGISSNTALIAGQTIKVPANTKVSNTTSTATARKDSYTVKTGDTLSGIADRHNMSVAQLASYNGLSTNSGVQVGQKLWLVPNKGAGASTARSTKTSSYKVKTGDTLYGIARATGTTAEEIARLNNMTVNTPLAVGQTIKIPAGKGSQATSQTTAQATGRVLGNTESYTVKSGDTLNSLASRYGVSVNDLARTNNLSSDAKLRAGQTIKVPKRTITYTVKSGDTLTSVAKRHGVGVDELAKINKLKSSDSLKIGQKLTIPRR